MMIAMELDRALGEDGLKGLLLETPSGTGGQPTTRNLVLNDYMN